MSRGVSKQVLSVVWPSVTCLLVVVAVLLLSGCGPSPGSSVMTTSAGVNLPPGISEPAAPAETTWPPGVAMVVLSTGYDLYAVDRDGVRWSQEILSHAEAAASDPPTPIGVAVSNNRQFIAYFDHGKDVVVRSLRDGAIVSRTPYQWEGETQLRCLSSDGYLAGLVSMQRPPQGAPVNRAYWRVTVLDLRTGEATAQQPLEDLAKQRTAPDPDIQFLLYSLDWLPEHRLVVNYAGWPSNTYVYDPATKGMEQIPGMTLVMGVSDQGTVYGGAAGTWIATPETWNGRATEALTLDATSAYALPGAFNLGGDALAVLAMSSLGEPRGWQLYRLSQRHWQPDGPLAENTWMKESPVALSDDGTVAWAVLQRNNGEQVLLSLDFRTGTWKEWLGPESLPVHLDWYRFEAIVAGN